MKCRIDSSTPEAKIINKIHKHGSCYGMDWSDQEVQKFKDLIRKYGVDADQIGYHMNRHPQQISLFGRNMKKMIMLKEWPSVEDQDIFYILSGLHIQDIRLTTDE